MPFPQTRRPEDLTHLKVRDVPFVHKLLHTKRRGRGRPTLANAWFSHTRHGPWPTQARTRRAHTDALGKHTQNMYICPPLQCQCARHASILTVVLPPSRPRRTPRDGQRPRLGRWQGYGRRRGDHCTCIWCGSIDMRRAARSAAGGVGGSRAGVGVRLR